VAFLGNLELPKFEFVSDFAFRASDLGRSASQNHAWSLKATQLTGGGSDHAGFGSS
jgi:hypothetical protein